MLHQLSLREKYFLSATIIALLLVITLPYVWAWAVTPQDFHYSGLLYNPDDQNVHLAWERQAKEGHFTISDAFTSESLDAKSKPLFINLYTWTIGSVSRLMHLPLILTHHLFRLIFAALAILWFYLLCCHFTTKRRTRYMATLFAAFSTGVGFLLPLFPGFVFMDRPDMAAFPMMPEAYIFTSAFIFGLNIAALALMVLIYERLIYAEETRSWKPVFVASAAAFILSNIHTYDAIPMLGILAIWLIWRIAHKSTFMAGAVASVIIGAILPVIYQGIVFNKDIQFRLKAITYTAAPAFKYIVVSYGLVFLLALVGIALVCRNYQGSKRALFLPVWIFTIFAFLYVPALMGHPLSFERKMIEGLHWPLCLLAAIGLEAGLQRIKTISIQNIIAASVLVFCCISSGQFIDWTLKNAQDNNESRLNVMMPPLYITDSDRAVMSYLRARGERNEAVLCLTFIGNYVPRESGMTVYLGHWAETVNYQSKLTQTVNFFTGKMNSDQAKEWLHKNHIGYILIGSYERRLGAKLPLELPQIFADEGAILYEVPR